MSKAEQQMEQRVLEALADLNKPPGLPESAYWSDNLALWIYQIVKLAARDAVQEVLTERLYWYPQPNWWQPIGEGATQAPDRGDPHVFDDYSPFNNRMTRRQQEQKEKEDEG